MIQKKVCILGPTGVGKTSLIKQFVEGIFSEKYKTTIGVKIDKKQVNKDGRGVQLLLWDLEGIDNTWLQPSLPSRRKRLHYCS